MTVGITGTQEVRVAGLGQRMGERLRLPSSRAGKAAAVALVLLVAGATSVGTTLGAPAMLASLNAAANPVRTAAPPAPALPHPALRAVGTDAPAPTSSGLAAVLDRLAGSSELGQFAGVVLDAAGAAPPGSSGSVSLWSHDSARRMVPGSTAKLVTAAAALLALDHDARLSTTVVAGAEPGTVVLVGGGDPTLSALPAGRESVYAGAPRLDDLAAQVRAAVPTGVSRVLVDVGRYTGDALGPGWLPADVPGGYVAPIVPVMLDGGRGVPTELDTPRSSTPALTAATELARRVGAPPGAVAVGTAPAGAAVLGTVRSQPIKELVAQALRNSDNVLAEVLAREVALATGAPPSFAGAVDAVRAVLTRNGIDTGELRLVDGSGLSAQNQVTARALAGLLAAVAAPSRADIRTARLRPLVEALPVAGGTGTLAQRYDGPAGAGRGYVRAKTGTLADVNSLAGMVLDADGRLLVFALLSNGSLSTSARPALDAIAAALRTCGCH
jgi:serine-type D-Ala-D-Ala carboxypeptidase/endopeptidase (penicillin-binding protein 4)